MGLGLNKYIEHHEELLFFIIIIEFIIILILALAVFFRRKDDENDKKDKGNISDISKKNNQDNDYWENEYYKIKKSYDKLLDDYKNIKYGRERKFNKNYSNYLGKTADIPSPQKTESNNPYSEYAKEERRKGVLLKEIKNEDGTIKSEIEFDDTSDVITPISTPPKYEYLEAANGGQFRKLLSSEEKCFFRTWEENGIRKFEFHGNIEKAIANINAIFDDVCDIEGKQNGATQIVNIEPGILDSQLKVDTRAKIKLL